MGYRDPLSLVLSASVAAHTHTHTQTHTHTHSHTHTHTHTHSCACVCERGVCVRGCWGRGGGAGVSRRAERQNQAISERMKRADAKERSLVRGLARSRRAAGDRGPGRWRRRPARSTPGPLSRAHLTHLDDSRGAAGDDWGGADGAHGDSDVGDAGGGDGEDGAEGLEGGVRSSEGLEGGVRSGDSDARRGGGRRGGSRRRGRPAAPTRLDDGRGWEAERRDAARVQARRRVGDLHGDGRYGRRRSHDDAPSAGLDDEAEASRGGGGDSRRRRLGRLHGSPRWDRGRDRGGYRGRDWHRERERDGTRRPRDSEEGAAGRDHASDADALSSVRYQYRLLRAQVLPPPPHTPLL